jgi:hypothetical protein
MWFIWYKYQIYIYLYHIYLWDIIINVIYNILYNVLHKYIPYIPYWIYILKILNIKDTCLFNYASFAIHTHIYVSVCSSVYLSNEGNTYQIKRMAHPITEAEKSYKWLCTN